MTTALSSVFSKRRRIVGLLLFVVVPIMSSVSPPKAGTRDAMTFHQGDTEIYEAAKNGGPKVRYRVDASARVDAGTPRDVAENRAIAAWRTSVEREFGAEFADWASALGKVVRCDPPGGPTYTCGVSAIPAHR